jgi:flagellar motility protein MotE (MotC chaperone)
MAKVKEKNLEKESSEKVKVLEQESQIEKSGKKQKLSKQEKKQLELDEKNSKKKPPIMLRIFSILITIAVIAFIAAVLKYNFLNIRDRYLNETLRKIPIVKNLVPADSQQDEQTNTITNEELTKEIEALKLENANKDNELKKYQDDTSVTKIELDRLKEFEDMQEQFKKDKMDFDEMIALNDPNAYSSFYKEINKENEQILFEAAEANAEEQKQIKKYVANFANMDESDVAAVLELMIRSDRELVILIMRNLDSKTSGAILGEMTPENAATLAKMLAP